MKWQPISEAPKDGTPLLLFGDHGVAVGSWQGLYGVRANEHFWLSDFCCDTATSFEPTHFMPLPNPPSQEK